MVLDPASPMWCHPWDTESSPRHGCTHRWQQFLLKALFFKAPASWGCQEVRGDDTPRPGGEVLSLLLVSTDGFIDFGRKCSRFPLARHSTDLENLYGKSPVASLDYTLNHIFLIILFCSLLLNFPLFPWQSRDVHM